MFDDATALFVANRMELVGAGTITLSRFTFDLHACLLNMKLLSYIHVVIRSARIAFVVMMYTLIFNGSGGSIDHHIGSGPCETLPQFTSFPRHRHPVSTRK